MDTEYENDGILFLAAALLCVAIGFILGFSLGLLF